MPENGVLALIPTFNEAANIAGTIQRLHVAAPDVDVLVIDDQSPDGTADVVRQLATLDNRIKLLVRTGARGLGPAYLDGFARGLADGYRLLVEMDADGSHPADALPHLIGAVSDSDDRVAGAIGSRWVPGGSVVNWPRSRIWISRCGSFYARHMLGIRLRDITAGYRVYKSSALKSIAINDVESQGYCFQIDVTRRISLAGLRLLEVPIAFKDREAGESKMSSAIVFEAMARITVWGVQRMLRRGMYRLDPTARDL